MTNIYTFSIGTIHTANINAVAVRRLRIISGRIDLTSDVAQWGTVFTVPEEHAPQIMAFCILGTDTYKGWFEMNNLNVVTRFALPRGTAIKFTLVYISSTDIV